MNKIVKQSMTQFFKQTMTHKPINKKIHSFYHKFPKSLNTEENHK